MREQLNYTIHTADTGKPALLFIHPLGADLHFWDECVALLSPHRTCIACDLRSAGESMRSAGPVSAEECVGDLDRLRSMLNIDKVILVGCAIGSMIAAAYADQNPGHTSALILSNPASRIEPAAGAALEDRADRVQAAGMHAILPEAVDNAFHKQPKDKRYNDYMDRFSRQDAAAYAQSARGFAALDVTQALQRLACPTLLVAARHDRLLPPEVASKARELIPRSEYAILEQAAHFAPFQRPVEFTELILDFIAGNGL
jgi:3-oxoadipate enol-lactonase